jgi:hypothetical protein
MKLDEYLEKLTSHFTGSEFAKEVKLAKSEFFERAGIIDETDSTFDVRMSQFLDWYLFTRKLSQHELTPLALAKQSNGVLKLEGEAKWLESLTSLQHSLFEFIKAKGDDIYIRDLMAGKKIIIKNSPITVGFSPDEVFDARLIPNDDSFIFTRGFCFHPPGARKYITREIKRVKKLTPDEKEQMMLKLIKMRYRTDQYKHIDVTHIYTDESKLKT